MNTWPSGKSHAMTTRCRPGGRVKCLTAARFYGFAEGFSIGGGGKIVDDADRAGIVIEAELEAIASAARGIKPPSVSFHCRECGELLDFHRRQFGLCFPCASRKETLERLAGMGF